MASKESVSLKEDLKIAKKKSSDGVPHRRLAETLENSKNQDGPSGKPSAGLDEDDITNTDIDSNRVMYNNHAGDNMSPIKV
jgi:hypothetical protein